MSSVPLRVRSPFFSFDAEDGSRRPRWYVFVAGILALALSGLSLVAGVSAASAHDKSWDASCFGGYVTLTNYNTNNADHVNHVSVKVDNVEQASPAQQANFGTGASFTWNWDPAVQHTIEIHVDGWDGYDLDVEKKTIPPCTLPTAGLQSTVCNTTAGTTNVTATFSGFASYKGFTETYAGVLTNEANVTVGTLTNLQTIAGGTYTWTGLEAGHVYTFTVTGNQHTTLTVSTTSTVVGCPQLKDFSITPKLCNANNANNGGVNVVATVTPGRAYSIIVTNGTTTYGTYNVLASNTAASLNIFIPLAENLTNLKVVMTDLLAPIDDANKEKVSIFFSTGPCPKVPTQPTIVPSVCTEVDGALTITVTLNGLVPTRTYEVKVDGALVDTIVAGSDTQGGLSYPVTAGSHTVTVTDKFAPESTVTSPAFVVEACPTDPGVKLTVVECSVPGGKGQITATYSGLGEGREYTVTITGNGSSVPGYVVPLTVTSATAPTVFSNLAPSVQYVVTIVDKQLTDIVDSASLTLEKCPLTPDITLSLECLLISGESLITGEINDLVSGDQYLVEVEDDSAAPLVGGGTAVSLASAPVAATTITAGDDPSTVTFLVPNNLNYTITVTSLANSAIHNSASIFAAICDPPTLPFPPELPTLALTGSANTTLPMLGALGLVQFGVALLALAAMLQFAPKRRRA